MKRLILATVTALALAAPAHADVTIKSTTAGKGLGMSGTVSGTTYIKGNRMRTDTVTGNTTRTVIFDVESQKMISFDSKKKEADVYDMQKLSAEISKNVAASVVTRTAPKSMTTASDGRTASTKLSSVVSTDSRGPRMR